ncbi:hypothetical protein P154DRAFT_423728 [Amniculicola lignicola CBS 123094]|uniref:RED-like N-terminal domain-containing protein n=1 Tax=Amniculicola lignicola CBS 123094 TaxID=1392246 RepID=A0A6A5WXK5_9PLEO|nr:hypothetical protein P154DRAFT_423728 [Amniculicola lignicola CBS 123094]
MNNEQFRKLLLKDSATKDAAPSSTPALGARSIRATPRPGKANYVYDEFQRQLAEQKAKEKKQRTFKSKAPQGIKLAEGYIDRTKLRQDDEQDEKQAEKARRIEKLEAQLKAKVIDRKMFDTMVQQIAGGDLSSTHLVKGLDYALLEKVKRGEHLAKNPPEEEVESADVPDEEFDELAAKEVASVAQAKVEKKGQKAMLPPPVPAPVAGQKRSRNDILAELKAQRKAAAEAAEEERKKKYALPAGFHLVGEKGETSRVETDSKGREVLVITDADGKTKRKVKKQKKNEDGEKAMPPMKVLDDPKKFMIKEAHPPPPQEEESEDEDIFAGVGSNYNPLADLEESDDDEEPVDKTEEKAGPPRSATVDSEDEGEIDEPGDKAETLKATSPRASVLQARRNYFDDAPSTKDKTSSASADATVKAALRKARELDPNSSLLKTEASEKEARLKKRAAELANDRDLQDMDMGFGGSRFDDAQEMENEGQRVKLSKWRGLDAQDDEDEDEDGEGGKGKGGGGKRKRGGKKRKGDKNSAVDILNAIERQKHTKTSG